MHTDVVRCEIPKVLDLSSLADGDRISVEYDPPLRDADHGDVIKASGTVRTIVGRYFLIADSHRQAWQMPTCFDLDPAQVSAVKLEASATEINDERARRARGDIVFDELPRTPADLMEQLDTLAEMIAVEPDAARLHSRKSQLEKQFDDVADVVALAKTKRSYILTRAIVGADFHPWLTRDDRVFRNGTVRPLPADFEFNRKRRDDRPARLEQSVRIFGEAERETRVLAGALRRLGYDVRRPHPNAQELYIRLSAGRMTADVVAAPSQNGLWTCGPRPADNKTKAKAIARLVTAKVLREIAQAVERATAWE